MDATDAGAPVRQLPMQGPFWEGEPRAARRARRCPQASWEPAADPQIEVLLAMRLLAARAGTGRQIARPTLAWLEQTFDRTPLEAWSESLRAAFMTVLRGPEAVGACELLDHVGGWAVLLPEWAWCAAGSSIDPWHRYTVDGLLPRPRSSC